MIFDGETELTILKINIFIYFYAYLHVQKSQSFFLQRWK